MTLDDAMALWRSHGWRMEYRHADWYAVMVYDDGGSIARSIDRDRGRGFARATLYATADGRVQCRLLSKATTNLLHWHRYLTARRHTRTAQAAHSRSPKH